MREETIVRIFVICTPSPSSYRVIKPIRLRWTGNVAWIEKRRRAYGVLLEKPERKRSLGRSKPKWKDNIKIDFQEVGCGVWTGSG
jgi:hypothetical protein